MKVFELSRRRKNSLHIQLSIALLIFILLPFYPVLDTSFDGNPVYLLMISMSVIMLIVYVFIRVNERIVLETAAIRKESAIGHYGIQRAAIRAYTIRPWGTVVIIPKQGKSLHVPHYPGQATCLMDWLTSHPAIREQTTSENPYDEIDNIEPGMTPEQRQINRDARLSDQIKKATVETYVLTGITVVLVVLTAIYRLEFPWMLWLLCSCIPVSLYLLKRHKGVLKILTSRDSPYPFMGHIPVIVAMTLPVICRYIMVLNDSMKYRPVIVIIMLLTGMLWQAGRAFDRRSASFIFGGILLFITFIIDGYFGTLLLNRTMYVGYRHRIVIKEKKLLPEDPFSAKLLIEPGIQRQHLQDQLLVPMSLFEQVQQQDTLIINNRTGLLGISYSETPERIYK